MSVAIFIAIYPIFVETFHLQKTKMPISCWHKRKVKGAVIRCRLSNKRQECLEKMKMFLMLLDIVDSEDNVQEVVQEWKSAAFQ